MSIDINIEHYNFVDLMHVFHIYHHFNATEVNAQKIKEVLVKVQEACGGDADRNHIVNFYFKSYKILMTLFAMYETNLLMSLESFDPDDDVAPQDTETENHIDRTMVVNQIDRYIVLIRRIPLFENYPVDRIIQELNTLTKPSITTTTTTTTTTPSSMQPTSMKGDNKDEKLFELYKPDPISLDVVVGSEKYLKHHRNETEMHQWNQEYRREEDKEILNDMDPTLNTMRYVAQDNSLVTNKIVDNVANPVAPGYLNSIKRIVQTQNLELNSCFRQQYYRTTSTDFQYTLPFEIPNVVSMRLACLELPNAWYLFSERMKTNSFTMVVELSDGSLQTFKITIAEGNYDYLTLQTYLNDHYFWTCSTESPLQYIEFSIDPRTLKSTFRLHTQRLQKKENQKRRCRKEKKERESEEEEDESFRAYEQLLSACSRTTIDCDSDKPRSYYTGDDVTFTTDSDSDHPCAAEAAAAVVSRMNDDDGDPVVLGREEHTQHHYHHRHEYSSRNTSSSNFSEKSSVKNELSSSSSSNFSEKSSVKNDLSPVSISLQFSTNPDNTRNPTTNLMNTMGWALGFRLANYENITTQVTSEGLYDGLGDTYVYVSINDYQYNSNRLCLVGNDTTLYDDNILAKIPMTNGKLSLIVNNNGNPLTKQRVYNGPVNLKKFYIKILNKYGQVIDLNSMDFSFTLELELLYENFNFKNISH